MDDRTIRRAIDAYLKSATQWPSKGRDRQDMVRDRLPFVRDQERYIHIVHVISEALPDIDPTILKRWLRSVGAQRTTVHLYGVGRTYWRLPYRMTHKTQRQITVDTNIVGIGQYLAEYGFLLAEDNRWSKILVAKKRPFWSVVKRAGARSHRVYINADHFRRTTGRTLQEARLMLRRMQGRAIRLYSEGHSYYELPVETSNEILERYIRNTQDTKK